MGWGRVRWGEVWGGVGWSEAVGWQSGLVRIIVEVGVRAANEQHVRFSAALPSVGPSVDRDPTQVPEAPRNPTKLPSVASGTVGEVGGKDGSGVGDGWVEVGVDSESAFAHYVVRSE